LAIWINEWAATIWMSGLAQAASAPHRAGQISPFIARIGADRCGQYTGHRRDRSIEAEFAEHREAAQRIRPNGADRRHQAERDRQIVVTALLRQIGWREIDRDSPRRQCETRGDQRRANPFAGLGDRLVGQSDDGESRQAGRDLHLHVDGAGFDPLKSYGGNPLNHAALCLRQTLA